MTKAMVMSKWTLFGMAAALLMVALGVVAATQIRAHGDPVGGGVIHSCVDDDGEIRIVDSSDSCTSDDDDSDSDSDEDGAETPLDWNAVGLQGPDGPDGADGANGINGSNGIDGTNGTNGTNGIDGADGAAGPAGADGAEGATGAQGPAGPAGVSNYEKITVPAGTRTKTANQRATATCTAGNTVLGGGFSVHVDQAVDKAMAHVVDDAPTFFNDGWRVEIQADPDLMAASLDGYSITVYAICANIGS